MYWKVVSNPKELEEYVIFEQENFNSNEWVTFEEYDFFIRKKKLIIYLLCIERGPHDNRREIIIGAFNIFIESGVVYMGGFCVGINQRGFRLSRTIMQKLLYEYKDYKIICKTKPKDKKMRRVLCRGGFKNNLDKFENGKIWSYWFRDPN